MKKLAEFISQSKVLYAVGVWLCLNSCTKTNSDISSVVRESDSLTVAQMIDTFRKQSRVDPAKAFSTINQLEHFIDSTHYERMLPKFYVNKGQYYYNTGNYDTAQIYYDKAVVLAKAQKNIRLQAVAYSNMGNLSYAKGDYMHAKEFYTESLVFFEKLADKTGISSLTGNLGVIYIELGEYKKAKEWLLKALKTRIELKDSIGMAQTYGNLGNVYYAEGDMKKCLQEQFRSYQIHKAIHNSTGIAMTLRNIAEIYQDFQQLDSAAIFASQAMEIHRQMNDQNGIASAYLTFANIAADKKDYALALDNLYKAKAIAQKMNSLSILKNVEEKLNNVYRAQKKYAEALAAFKNYISYRDTIFNTEQLNELNKKEIQFENDKKEALTIAELQRQKLVRNGTTAGAGLLLIILFITVRNFYNKRKINIRLSQQKHIIEEKQKEIVDSINYALQIQKALLANHEVMGQGIPQNFVVFKPKDIVSGDFYWAASVGSLETGARSKGNSELITTHSELFYLAVCDSTGHGVPGAFMSLLNINFLNEATKEKRIKKPGEIFDHVRNRLVEGISRDGRKDGMDGILLCFDKKNNVLTYSAANNAPLLISNHEIIRLPANKMPVGKGEKNESFSTFTIEYKKGDMLYAYTDGYPDQFGGEKGKKFKLKQLETLLLSVHTLPCDEQARVIDREFETWKGPLEQIDDVCIIGIRL